MRKINVILLEKYLKIKTSQIYGFHGKVKRNSYYYERIEKLNGKVWELITFMSFLIVSVKRNPCKSQAMWQVSSNIMESKIQNILKSLFLNIQGQEEGIHKISKSGKLVFLYYRKTILRNNQFPNGDFPNIFKVKQKYKKTPKPWCKQILVKGKVWKTQAIPRLGTNIRISN